MKRTRGGRSPGAVDQLAGRAVALSDIRSPRVDLSSLDPKAGPFPILYEPFHYLALPSPRDMTCTVIKALGDKFDILAYILTFESTTRKPGRPAPAHGAAALMAAR